MVVHDLHVVRAVIRPTEAHAELVVHANAILTRTVAFQEFQPVARWHAQIVQSTCLVQLLQLATSHRLYVDKSAHSLSIEQGFRIRALKRLDHGLIVTMSVINVKRDYLRAPTGKWGLPEPCGRIPVQSPVSDVNRQALVKGEW
jgi:hypothetical protein